MIIAAAHESSADGAFTPVACSRVVRHYNYVNIETAKPKTANNRKIQLKRGLKIAHYLAEVKRKTINRNLVATEPQ